MKFLILLSLLTSPAFALGPAELENLLQGTEIARNMDFTNFLDNCSPENAPAHCQDLFGQTCSVPKKSTIVKDIGDRLDQTHWRKLPAVHTDAQLVATFEAATNAAEAEVNRQTGLHRENDIINDVFNNAKASLEYFITSRDLVKPASIRSQMASRVRSVKLRRSSEYVSEMVKYAKSQGATSAEVTLKAHAYRQYMASCGRNGLSPNAFYDEVNGERFIVLCPGLALGMKDYGIEKETIKDALGFVMGHELGHSIDSSVYPHAYTSMGQCYRNITGADHVWDTGMSDEISADYWGAIALSDRIVKRGNNRPQDNVNLVAYATEGFCSTDHEHQGGGAHPPAIFRVNQTIGRHIMITEALECPVPGPRNPYCSLSGEIPRPQTSR